MRRDSMWRGVGLVLLLFSPIVLGGQSQAPALQRLVREIQSYFPQVDGDLLEVKGDRVIVSLGEKDELQRGTELLLVREGRELVHPKTKEVLGHVETELGRVLIEEVSERYSVGRVIAAKEGATPAVGDRVRISSGRVTLELLSLLGPTVGSDAEQGIIDTLAQALEQSGRFRIRVADLARHWIQEEKIPSERVLKNPALLNDKVAADHVLLLLPEGGESRLFAARLLSLRASTVKLSALLPLELSTSRTESAPREPTAPRAEPARPQAPASTLSFFTPTASGFSKAAGAERKDEELGKFDRLFVSVDMVIPKSDGVARVVATDGERIFLYRLEPGGLKEEIRYAPSKRGQLLSVQFASLGSPDEIHVVVNQQIRDVGMASLVLLLQDKSLTLLAEDTTNILLALDKDGDGVKETLWGQRYDPQNFFSRGAVRRLTLQGGRLSEAEAVEVPAIFRATGAALATFGNASDRLLVFVDAQHFLQIARGREIVWSSPERVGGGYALGEVVKSVSGLIRQTERVAFEPNPLVADLDGDGMDEVLVPRNVSPATSFLNLGNFGSGSGGEVMVVYREGAGFGLRAITSKLPGLVSGLGLISRNPLSLFVAVSKANFPPIPGGKSQFLISQSAPVAR